MGADGIGAPGAAVTRPHSVRVVLAGFDYARVDVGEVTLNLARAGEGPPLLLLHGYPETHVMWHLVAPRLAERYDVVAPDLRGYGDSDKPPGDPEHRTYAKRTMAADAVALMASLGHRRFAVAGHDRGARVAHRMALDHPDAVARAALLDIIPTWEVFARVDAASARSYYHWFFLSQPFDLPERLIEPSHEGFLSWTLDSWTAAPGSLAPQAVAEYRRCFADPATIHATCEDYRAGASIDLEHDEADLGRRVACPLLVLWGESGRIAQLYDVLGLWRERGEDVRGGTVSGGHFCAEEAPEETLAALLPFLAEGGW
jgi:haloacetate dehalogenase